MKEIFIIKVLILFLFNPNILGKEVFELKKDEIEPKILTFENKVPIKSLSMVKELPSGRTFKFSFEVNSKKIERNTIKMPSNGNFNLTIKKGTKFSVIDNDGTDGNAIIELPENAVNYFLGVPDKDDDKKVVNTGKITVEDKLYYTKQEMKAWTKKERETFFEKEKKGKKEDEKAFSTKDEKSEKEYESNGTCYTVEKEEGTWYKLGKRAVSIPSEWKADNGNNYVLNFKNEGISNFILRGYKQDNANDFSYPDGINLIGVKGGVVELTGVGKLELPEGALDKDTFISMKQELQAYQYIIYSGEHPTVYDYISPVIKIEPFGLKLNKTAKIYAETDIKRLGNNHPYVLKDSGSFSIDKKKWITSYDIFPDGIKKLNWKTNFPAAMNQLGFFAKFIFNFMEYDSGYGYYSDDS